MTCRGAYCDTYKQQNNRRAADIVEDHAAVLLQPSEANKVLLELRHESTAKRKWGKVAATPPPEAHACKLECLVT